MAQSTDSGWRENILFFTRYPSPGRVKTRLIPTLGPEGAAALHDRMARTVFSVLAAVSATRKCRLSIFYTGADKGQMARWLGHDHSLYPQHGHGLGERMANAMGEAAATGCKRVLLVGSDCPAIDEALVNQAFSRLVHHDLVLGPAHDGGYYLIGLQTGIDHRPLFHGIDWGTEKVLEQTLAQVRGNGYSHSLLPLLHDIDRSEDLVHFDYHPGS